MNPIWPFNRRPREAKSAPPLVALSEVGEARWGSRDGAALTRDGYLANAIAYRAVRMVAEAAAAVPAGTHWPVYPGPPPVCESHWPQKLLPD